MFELPKDLVMDIPRITLLGNLQITIENHRGILEYGPERIVIGVTTGQLTITGWDLAIGTVYPEEITISGRVAGLSFSA